MTLSEVNELLKKIKRIQTRLNSLDGEGFEWNLVHEDHGYQSFSLSGIKTPEDLQDEIENGLIWLWSLKDYVKKYSKSLGKGSSWVEKQIDNSTNLCLCADIANSLKHGGIDRKSRSGKKPVLSHIRYEVPQNAIDSLSLDAHHVAMNIAEPSELKVSMDIIDEDKAKLGNAFLLIQGCLLEWEKLIEKANTTSS